MGQNQCCCSQEGDGVAGVIYEGNAEEKGSLPISVVPMGNSNENSSRTQPPVEPVAVPAKAETPPLSPRRQDDRQPFSSPVTFEFDYNGVIKPVTFTKRPLGMTFANTLPLTVTKIVPGTEAEAQGIQPGWVFTKVGGVSLDGMDLERIVQLIQQKSVNLAPATTDTPGGSSISFEFEVEGMKKTVTFLRRPLGMTFANKLPLTVTKIVPGSEAEKRGVQSGWVFSKVGDTSLEKMDLEKIVSLILEKSVHLPMDR
jgi:hypothetical protein